MRLALALGFLVAGIEPAAAEPISAAIGLTALITSAGVGAATAAAVGGFIVSGIATVGVSLGLAALNKAMAEKPRAGETLSGLEANVQIGGDIARQVAIGYCGAKGQLVYHNSPPSQQHLYYQQVYALSDWLCDGLSSLFVNGKATTLTPAAAGGGLTNYTITEHAPHIQIAFYDGSQTAADSSLVSLAQPAGRWTADSKMTGMSYVLVNFTYEKGAPVFEGGIPKLTFGLRGARLYDWRQDSTAGGSGAQRWDNPSTWTYSQNPAVAVYNYLRGFYKSGELMMGMGVPASDILIDTFTAAANICDEPVTLDVGGTEPRYRVCTFLSADQSVTHAQTLEVLLSTMAGYLYDYSGFYYLQAGAGYTTVATVTDNDLVTGAGVIFTAKRSRSELINRIHGQFINTVDEFQPGSYTPQISATGVASDMEELGKQLDLASVPSQHQAERIAQIRLREVRRQGSASITLGFEHLNKQVGDWLTWNSGRYGSRIWRIVNKMVDATSQTVTIELVETNSNVYSWTTADEGDPVIVGLPIVGSSQITQPAAFQIHAVTLPDAAGNQAPGLKFTWTPIVDQTVDAVVIEWRKVGTTIATRVSDPSVDDGQHQTTDGVVGGLDYEARATITTTPPRITTWTPWVSITTTFSVFNLAGAVDTPADIPTGLVLTSAFEISAATGETQTRLDADWNNVAGATVTYEIQIKEGAGNYVTFPTATSNYTWRGLAPGTFVTARVRSITGMGSQSGYSAEVTHTVAADTVPPGAATSFGVSAAFQTIFLSWVNPADKDLSHIEVWEAATNDRSTATLIAKVPAPGTTYTRGGLAASTTRYYWIRTVDTSGNFGPYTPTSATGGVAGITQGIISADIAAGAINQTQLANTLRVPDVVATLPPTGNWTGRVVILSSDSKSYKWNGTAWVRAYGDDVLGIDSIQASTVVAGAIGVNQLAAKAVTTEKLAIGTKNVAFNGDMTIGSDGQRMSGYDFNAGGTSATRTYRPNSPWAPSSMDAIEIAGPSSSGTAFMSNHPVLYSGAAGVRYAVTAGHYYEASAALSAHRCAVFLQLRWYNSGGSIISSITGNTLDDNQSNGGTVVSFPRSSAMGVAPVGAVTADLLLTFTFNGRGSPLCYVSAVLFAGADAAQLTGGPGGTPAFSPYTAPGITIIERGQIRTGEIITEHMVANTITGDRIQADTLNANRIQASTTISGSVLVGSFAGGTQTLATTAFQSEDPAARVNAKNTTQILPGLINVSGATTLASWRDGGDLTKISGGNIAANTIAANSVKIGVRGLDISGLQFQVVRDGSNNLTDTVQWSAGNIMWVNDAGSNVQTAIVASSTPMTIGACIYWHKGNGFLSYDAFPPAVIGGENILMMTYLGGGAMTVTYGGTIIDGTQITTRSLNATRIQANSITATEVLQTAVLITGEAMIGTATIGTLKVVNGAISEVYGRGAGVANGGRLTEPSVPVEAGRRYIIQAHCRDDLAASRLSFSGFTPLNRQFQLLYSFGGDNPLYNFWGYDTVMGVNAGTQYVLRMAPISGMWIWTSTVNGNVDFSTLNLSGIDMAINMTIQGLKR